MFMRTAIKSDDGRNIPIMTMGPICITPELKRQGYAEWWHSDIDSRVSMD